MRFRPVKDRTVSEFTASDYRKLIAEQRKAYLNLTKENLGRLESVFDRAVTSLQAKLAALPDDQTLRRRYLQNMLADMEATLTRLRGDYGEGLNGSMLASAQAAVNRETLIGNGMGKNPDPGSAAELSKDLPAFGPDVSVQFGKVALGAVERAAQRVYSDGFRLSDRLYSLDAETKDAVRGTIVQGVAEQLSAREMAVRLQSAMSEEGKAVPRYRAMTIARTEITAAHREAHIRSTIDPSTGNLKSYIMAVGWRLSASHPKLDMCCRAGTLVETKLGNIIIEDVKIGDEVRTHLGRWMPVTRCYRNSIPAGWLVRICYQAERNRIHDLVVTPNHPVLTDRGWTAAGDLRKGCRVFASTLVRGGSSARSKRGNCGREQSDFGGSLKSEPQQNNVAELYDEPSRPVLRTSCRRLQESLSPISILPIGSDNDMALNRRHNLDCRRPFEIETSEVGIPAYASVDQDDVFQNWDLRSRFYFGRLPRMFVDFWRNLALRILCRTFCTQAALRRAERGSRSESNISEMLRPLSPGTQLNIPGMSASGALMSLVRRNDDYRIAEPVIGPASRLRGYVQRAFVRRIRNISEYLSYLYSSIIGGYSPFTSVGSAEQINTSGEDVYNLSVLGDHSFFANGIAVHNCDLYADDDHDNLGPGNYEPTNVPQSHPRCMCFTVSILELFPDQQFVSKLAVPDEVPESEARYAAAQGDPVAARWIAKRGSEPE